MFGQGPGPMPPEVRRGFRVAIPVWLVAALGMGIGALGDQNGSMPLVVVGVGTFVVAFVVLGIFVFRQMSDPVGDAWFKALRNSPLANRFNTVVCSVLVVGGLFILVRNPSPFAAVFVVIAAGMLVMFIRRGWF